MISLEDKAVEIHKRLCSVYNCPIRYFRSVDPLTQLVNSLLSHRTRNADSSAATKALQNRYPTWNDVIDAPTAEVEATIAQVTWPEQKAPRIQAILRSIQAERGALNLDFLEALSVNEARA